MVLMLTSVEVARDRLGYGVIEDIETALRSALQGATSDIASWVRCTDFTSGSFTDTFYIENEDIRERANPRTALLLKRGFVKTSPAVIVKSSTTFDGLSESSATILTDSSQVVYEKGLVFLLLDNPLFNNISRLGREIANSYVQVLYDAGFAADSKNDELFDQTLVPDWLTEMAISAAVVKLDQNPNIRSEDRNESEVATHNSYIASLVQSHTRFEPTAKQPLF